MRILLMGQAAFGVKVLEKLSARSKDVAAVYTPPDGPGGRMDPLKEAAVAAGIDVYQPHSYHDDRVFSTFKNIAPDLMVMAYVTDIIPVRLLDAPSRGSICYHPSLLPRHRGASAVNWSIIMGDAQTGLTIFWADGGIDTGPVLLQKTIDIHPQDTTGSLYFNRLFPMGVESMIEAVELIERGDAPRIAQDETGATYEPPCDDKVAAIDWRKPDQDVYNLIRGCDPQPGAFSFLKGEKVRFYGVSLTQMPTDHPTGTVVHVDDRGFAVSVSGGQLTVTKIRTSTHGKISAAAFASAVKLQTGDRFGRQDSSQS